MWIVPKGDGYEGDAIKKVLGPLAVLAAVLSIASVVCAQSADSDANTFAVASSFVAAETSATLPPPIIPNRPLKDPAANIYVRPTQQQKFRSYAWNAVGPVALA